MQNSMTPITVMSLFDGMACGLVALKRAGIPVGVYWASEIDKHAVIVAQNNHSEIVHLGCVVKLREMVEAGMFGHVDLLIGGSPCQGLSFAGKQLGMDDPRSALFYEYVRIMRALKKQNPDLKVLLENTRMKKESLDLITRYMGCGEPHFINSALVSAQNRQRHYWYNWEADDPVDRGILLEDIIEDGFTDRDKAYCITATYGKGSAPKDYFNKGRRQLVFIEQHPRGKNSGGVKALDGKTPTLTANSWHTNNKVTIDGGYSYRMLTPVECERLQNLDDNYSQGVSKTQRYKMLGNGWNVETVTHLFRSMFNAEHT